MSELYAEEGDPCSGGELSFYSHICFYILLGFFYSTAESVNNLGME